MIIQRVIQYSDLYPEQKDKLPDPRSLIKGLKREDLCTIIANMMNRLDGHPFFDNSLDIEKGEFDFVRFFLSCNDPVFTQDVIQRYLAAKNKLPSTFNWDYVATSKPAIVAFQRLVFSVTPDVTQSYDTNTEQAFFKALLLINQDVYDAEYDDAQHSNEPVDLQLAHIYLAYNYANEDIEALDLPDLFRRQLIKSISLFTFLFRSKDSRIRALRRRFLSYYHVGNWVEYLIPHIMTIHFLKRQSGFLVIKGGGKNGKRARRVIEKSCIEKDRIIPINENADFAVFRSCPYIKIKNHTYAIISPSFVVEHMFNSVYFKLRGFSKDAGFSGDDDFRRYYTTEFSHKYMFEGYMRQCIPSNVEKSLSGSQCDEILENLKNTGKKVDGIVPPDYYVKVPEGCIVMEYKDALTGAKVKESRASEKLFIEIKKKFFENDEGRHKGISQLLDSVENIQKGTFYFDNPSKTSVVYPILVVDNPVYTMRGMHTVLNHLMREECLMRGIRTEYVKPLILMDVATLRLYSDCLNNNGLIATFENYYKYVSLSGRNAQEDQFKSLMSFTEYMKDKDLGDIQKIINRISREAKTVLNG